jgi:hypothetical protein
MKTNVRAIMINAKECLVKGDTKMASDHLNRGIATLAQMTIDGVTHVDGTSVDRWKERFWYELEENELLEG